MAVIRNIQFPVDEQENKYHLWWVHNLVLSERHIPTYHTYNKKEIQLGCLGDLPKVWILKFKGQSEI